MIRLALTIAGIAFICAVPLADTFTIPGDFTEIQAGIDAAAEGDTVLVEDGIYLGEGNHDLDFQGKNLILKSTGGYENCIIDGSGYPHLLSLQSGETGASVIEGFTFTSAYNSGIYLTGASPAIKNCLIEQNTGGGVKLYDSEAVIERCVIAFNSSAYGGGLYLENSSPDIIHCTFRTNAASSGGAVYGINSTVEFTNSIFYYNLAVGG